jgi:hypothetical protein
MLRLVLLDATSSIFSLMEFSFQLVKAVSSCLDVSSQICILGFLRRAQSIIMEGEKANYDLVYFDCFSGVAGDMMLASMFDAVPVFFLRFFFF